MAKKKTNRSKTVKEVISYVESKMPLEVRNAKYTTRPLTPKESTTESRLKRALGGLSKK